MRWTLTAGLLIMCATSGITRAPTAENKNKDPNRVICRTEEVIGSRLQSKRTCLTAIQWDQLERDQRFTTERVQQFKPNSGN